MELQFRIKETGKDSVVVRAALVDIVAWEDRFERPSSTMGGDSIFARDFGIIGALGLCGSGRVDGSGPGHRLRHYRRRL